MQVSRFLNQKSSAAGWASCAPAPGGDAGQGGSPQFRGQWGRAGLTGLRKLEIIFSPLILPAPDTFLSPSVILHRTALQTPEMGTGVRTGRREDRGKAAFRLAELPFSLEQDQRPGRLSTSDM